VDRGEVVDRVRELRAKGVSPKAIARAVGLPPSQVTPMLRALAEENEAGAAQRRVECWVSPGWSNGLRVDPDRQWPDDAGADVQAGGLASVLVAREEGRGRVSVCGHLVDVYCLGVKNAIGPRVMDPHGLDAFVAAYFGGYERRPVAAPLELARHLVFGAVEYARGLGFEPHPDFAATAAHLGEWEEPAAITFGRDGEPMFIQGPYDDARKVMSTLERAVGAGNFHFTVTAGDPRTWSSL
jgi:hypothetical protein